MESVACILTQATPKPATLAHAVIRYCLTTRSRARASHLRGSPQRAGLRHRPWAMGTGVWNAWPAGGHASVTGSRSPGLYQPAASLPGRAEWMWCQMRGLRVTLGGIVAAATLAGVVFVGAATAAAAAPSGVVRSALEGGRAAVPAFSAPGPATLDNLYGVSCVSGSFCMAVGEGAAAGAPLAEAWNGSTWRVVKARPAAPTCRPCRAQRPRSVWASPGPPCPTWPRSGTAGPGI